MLSNRRCDPECPHRIAYVLGEPHLDIFGVIPLLFIRRLSPSFQCLIAIQPFGAFPESAYFRVAAPFEFPKTPAPFFQAQCFHTRSSDRIQMDIPAQLRTIELGFNQDRFEPALEQVTRTPVITVFEYRERCEEGLHEPGKIRLRSPDVKMKMVSHHAVGEYLN